MLVDYLRPRKVLLVLDNCEHLIDACAQLADELLRSCPQLRILASSREALGIAGERAFRVQSLSLPSADKVVSADELAEYDAIQLFVTRAKAVKSDFSLTGENAPEVLQICRRLDGIPLAIELAAARARLLAPQQILDRLDDRFRLLTGGSRTALPRQRTLQALIDWSYDLLTEPERVLLRRLSVFSGGWTVEAAETVAGTDPLEPFEVLDLLEQLHNKSLITAGNGELHMRHGMLETVRQYAQLKLSQSGEADQVRDRHLAYFVDEMEKGTEAILTLRSTGWLELASADKDNFRAARARALETDVRHALRFVANITPHWTVIFPAAEALQFLESSLQLAELSPHINGPGASAENRRLLAVALASGAFLALFLGLPETSDYASRSAEIAREQGEVTYLVLALVSATARAANSGDVDSARKYHQELRQLIPNLDSAWVKALVFQASSEENAIQAWKVWDMGMAMFRQSSEFWGLAYGHQMAARASFNNADFTKAEYHARRSLELYADFGDVHMVNMPRSLLADLARQKGDLNQAEPLYQDAASGWRNVGQFGALARCLESLAFVNHARAQAAGEVERARYLSRSIALLGAANAIRQIRNTPMDPVEHSEYEDELAQIKASAGETLFSEAWLRGQAMDPDQAVAVIQEPLA
jgi:predicted ATPase